MGLTKRQADIVQQIVNEEARQWLSVPARRRRLLDNADTIEENLTVEGDPNPRRIDLKLLKSALEEALYDDMLSAGDDLVERFVPLIFKQVARVVNSHGMNPDRVNASSMLHTLETLDPDLLQEICMGAGIEIQNVLSAMASKLAEAVVDLVTGTPEEA